MKFRFQLYFFLFPFISHAMQQQLPPLLAAARDGNFARVQQLVEQGANINQVDEQYRANALFWALQERHEQVALYLIRETNININDKNIWGSSVGILSSSQFLPEVTNTLIARKDFDVTAVNKNGRTLLDFEAINISSDGTKVKQILERGGSIFKQQWGKHIIFLLQQVKKTPCNYLHHTAAIITYGIADCPSCQIVKQNIQRKLILADEIEKSIKHKIA